MKYPEGFSKGPRMVPLGWGPTMFMAELIELTEAPLRIRGPLIRVA